METRVWQRFDKYEGEVLALTGDTLYRFTFNSSFAKRETTEAVSALLGGREPAAITAGKTKSVPLGSIERVEVSHDRANVKFYSVKAGHPSVVKFVVGVGDDAPAIARTVVDRAAIRYPERGEEIGTVEALAGPAILGVMVGVVWGLVYATAAGIEWGEKVNPGGRSSRIKVLLAFVAGMLGWNGTIVVGAFLLAAFLGWAVRRIVKRPQRLVWGPPTP